MANQMIALQARGPQLPNLGAAAAQYGNMMANMAVMKEKQAGIQRANAFRQLVSDPGFDPANPEHIKVAASLNPEGAEQIARSFDARRKAGQEFNMGELKRLRDIGAAVGDEAGYQAWLAQVEKVSPAEAAAFRQYSPNFDPDKMNRIIMTADQFISKSIPTPSASFQVSENGAPQSVTVGGLQPSVKEIPQFRYTPDQPAPRATVAPSAPPVTAAPQAPSAFDRAFGEGIPAGEDAIDAAAQAIVNGAGVSDPALKNLTPKEFDEANLRAGKLMLAKPIAAEVGPGEIAPLTVENAPQIIQTAIQNGFMDQSHVEQLRQMVGPENAPAVDTWLQQNGVQVSPAGAPGMRTAVYRPQAQEFGAPVADDGMSFGGPANALRQNIGYEPTTTRFKSPMQSPMPGSAIVPLPRVKGEAEAGEAGKQSVRVTTEPQIAGGTKKAELQAQKDMAFPDAQAQFEAALATIDNRLADIKRFRAHPAATRVIGPLDAFTPNFGRARGAQAIYDALVATATLDELQQMRQNSPTGGALGNVSDADIRVLRQSIGALGQDQSEEDFNESLRIFEDRLKTARDRLIRRFKENYGYKLGKDWQPPATSNRRQAPARGRRVGGFTVMEVED